MFTKIITALIVTLAASLHAKADTITLDSANNGTYKYSFTQDNVDCGYEWFRSGSQFVFSGLSGVTGASTLYSSLISTSFTATSVTYTLNSIVGVGAGTFNDIFTITSSMLNMGNVSFSIPTSSATTGAVAGPVASTAIAATPEPSSLALLGTGLLGMVILVARRSRGSSPLISGAASLA